MRTIDLRKVEQHADSAWMVTSMQLQAGETSEELRADNSTLVYCLEGAGEVRSFGETAYCEPEQFVALPVGAPYTLHTEQGVRVLVIRAKAAASDGPTKDNVDEALEETFPASDPPSW